MDVAIISGNSIRIKGKTAALVINPTSSTGKTEADALLVLDKSLDINDSKIEGSRISIDGPGEFEVGGIKISTTAVDGKLVARIDVDSVKILTGSGESIEKIQDKVEGSDIVVVNAQNKFNYSVLPTLEPKVVLLYGDLKEEATKSLGNESSEKVTKFSSTADKLPSEVQYILLG
jgi:hypothetical protein